MPKESKLGIAESPDPGVEEIRSWQELISKTESWRDQKAGKFGWDKFVREYNGDWGQVQQGLDIPLLPINLVFAYAKTEISRLYFRDPWITVNPKRSEDLGAARIAEQLVNYMWGELNLKSEIKRALLDAILVGHGWIKLGYSAEFGTVESQKPPAPRGRGRPRKEESRIDVEVNEFIKAENMFAYHIPWKDVLFSPDSRKPPYDARWMAFRAIRPLRAVLESGIYENTDELKPSKTDMSTKSDLEKYIQAVTLWEIWDKDHNQVITISPGCTKPLRRVAWPYVIDGFPATMFGFNINPEDPYPLSDIAPWEPHIIELMKMLAIMINHLKRWNRQIFVKEGFMTEEEIAKFKMGIDGAIIRYQGNPSSEIFLPPYAAVQQDIYGVWNLIMDLWKNISGQSDVERGAPVKGNTRTLGELRLALQGGRSRADEKIDSLEDSISEVARKLLSIMQQKLTLPKIVRMVGPKAVEESVLKERPSAKKPELKEQTVTTSFSFSVIGEDIHGEMDVDTLAGSTVPLNKENKLKMYDQLIQSADALGFQPNGQARRELVREMLREIDIKSLDRIMDIADEEAGQVQEQQSQEEQQMAQLATQAQVSKHQSDIVKAQAGAQKAAINVQGAKIKMGQKILEDILKRTNGTQEGSLPL